MLTDEQIDAKRKGISFYAHEDRSYCGVDYVETLPNVEGQREFARVIEAAATAPLLAKIAELERRVVFTRDRWQIECDAKDELVAEQQKRIEVLRRLIADDAHACTFQSLGQYRSALLAALNPTEKAS
jgi:hypothetical protein